MVLVRRKDTGTASTKPQEKEDEHLIVEEDEESATEDDPAMVVPAPGMSEVDAEERETEQKMWLAEKVTSLEKENGELKKTLLEMATRLATQENITCRWTSYVPGLKLQSPKS